MEIQKQKLQGVDMSFRNVDTRFCVHTKDHIHQGDI